MRRIERRYADRVAVRQLHLPVLALLAAGAIIGCLSSGGCRSGNKAPPPPATVRASPLPMPSPVKAVWIARFQYHFPDDMRTIMRNCAQDGFNTVLWQVRGNATVAYPSRLEPWSAEYGYRDPGFDPLEIAVEEAHKHGLRIEAWVNVMPGWRGSQPPPVQDQLWHTHPEWFLYDEAGNRQPLGRFYVILNPCLPEVRRYIVNVIDEIVTNYDVDGVHLDYVRYAWDGMPDAREHYPRDPATLGMYRQQTGRHPDDDPRAWDTWRAEQLTRLVSDIRDMLGWRRPGATLTAAVWSSPASGYRDYFQNAVAWLRAGIVDAAMPMAYTPKLEQFEGYIEAYRAHAPQARIIPGLGIYRHETTEQIGWQLECCRNWGGDFALFSYDALHATAGDRGKDGKPRIGPKKRQLRQMRAVVVQRFNSQ